MTDEELKAIEARAEASANGTCTLIPSRTLAALVAALREARDALDTEEKLHEGARDAWTVANAERDECSAALEWVQSEAAVMREALESRPCMCSDYERSVGHLPGCIAGDSLAPDAGRTLLAEVAALREVAEALRAADCRFTNDDGDGVTCAWHFRDALARLDALKQGGGA